jgi:hypothetical protein
LPNGYFAGCAFQSGFAASPAVIVTVTQHLRILPALKSTPTLPQLLSSIEQELLTSLPLVTAPLIHYRERSLLYAEVILPRRKLCERNLLPCWEA